MFTSSDKPVRVGLVGLGGYARVHLGVLNTLEAQGICQLVAAAYPFAGANQDVASALKARSVDVYSEVDKLFTRDDIEAVFIASPIPLHAAQCCAALAAGKHVYLEKPPAGSLEDWEAMDRAQKSSGKICVVGFQMQTTPSMSFLKQRLDEGALGQLQNVWVATRWRRNDAYYGRAGWAGKLTFEGQCVNDGPATNALAHVTHGALYLAGAVDAKRGTSALTRVRAALRRARPIESYDSCYVEAQTRQGAMLQLAFTHATVVSDEVAIHCRGTKGYAEIRWSGQVLWAPDGQEPRMLEFPFLPAVAAPLDFCLALRDGHRPITLLEDTHAYMTLVDAALKSSGGPQDFPAQSVRYDEADGGLYLVEGLDQQLEDVAKDHNAVPGAFAIEGSSWQELA